MSISDGLLARCCYVPPGAPAEGPKRDHWGDVMQRTASNGIGIALALGLAGASGATQAALSCASLTSVTPEASTITSAGIVTPPATIGGAAVTVAFCRVQGVAGPRSTRRSNLKCGSHPPLR